MFLENPFEFLAGYLRELSLVGCLALSAFGGLVLRHLRLAHFLSASVVGEYPCGYVLTVR